MRLTSSQTNHGAPEQFRDVFDDVAVGHRNAKDRRTRPGRSAAEKRALAFEDANEPVELKLFYVGLCVVKREVVSMGLEDSEDWAAKRFRTATERSTTSSAAITP